MAKFIGSEIKNGNYGEDLFCEVLSKAFPDNYIIYRNRQIFGREFDMAMLMPDIGIVIFEIKGWRESTVLRVENGDTIVISTEDGEKKACPQKQVRGYRFAMERRLRQDIGEAPLVYGMVVYPQISKEYFNSSGMKAVTEEAFTVLKEDLADISCLQSKISQAVNEVKLWHRPKFDAEFMYNTRCIFEGDLATYSKDEKQLVEIEKFPQPPYSKFYYIPAGKQITDGFLDEIGKLYNQGCKLFAVVGTREQMCLIVSKLDAVLDNKSLYRTKDKLSIRHEAGQYHVPEIHSLGDSFIGFNCNISVFSKDTNIQAFCVTDGEAKEHKKDLELLGADSSFNYEQYSVEHTPVNSNIIIRAGAGTGKTYTMISRIGYIAHYFSGCLSDLFDKITMITFTNEAADQMKRKLKEYFRNFYLLSGDESWLLPMARIDYMQISTIHSYAKKIIEKLGIESGYGADVAITSSEFTRQHYVVQLIDDYINEKKRVDIKFEERLNMPMYELVNVVCEFIRNLHNKSVDVATLNVGNFGTIADPDEDSALHELIAYIVPKVESEYQKDLLEENKVHLSSIMSVLQNLMHDPDSRERIRCNEGAASQFVFVDEFQDTDDTQIAILVELCSLLNAKMFVVGDIKQCIYRFRGATEEAFEQLPKNESYSWAEYALTRNYRTDSQLLDIFDVSFKSWAEEQGSLLVYHPERDRLKGIKHLNKDELPENYYRCITINDDRERMNALFEEIDRICEWINREVASGKKLSSEDRTIAILVRENWQAELIKEEGKQRKCNIWTNTGGDLYQTAAAIDMLSLANALIHYDEPEYLLNFISSNFMDVNIRYSNLYKIRQNANGHGWMLNASAQNEMRNYLISKIDEGLGSMPSGYDTWKDLVNSLRTEPILQVLHRIYDALKPELRAGESKWERQCYRMNVDLLFEQILAACNTDALTINTFAKSLSISIMSGLSVNSRAPIIDEEASIQCITVHKSKGLEYGHVIVPFAGFQIDILKKGNLNISVANGEGNAEIGYSLNVVDKKHNSRAIDYKNTYFNETAEKSERSREETRILYVAMTRAIRSFSWIRKDGMTGKSWQSIIKKLEV